MATRKGRSWFRIITGALMALVCAVLLFQFWLFAQVVWYNYRDPGSSAIMREELSRLREGNPATLDVIWREVADAVYRTEQGLLVSLHIDRLLAIGPKS